MAGKSAPNFSDGDEWEICNDDGFVFKRRRPEAESRDPAPPAPQPSGDPEAELRRYRRELRRRCLLALKEKYQRELDHWEALSASSLHPPLLPSGATASADGAAISAAPSPPPPPALPPPAAAPEAGSSLQLVDELLAQAEAHEAILAKASQICDYAESLCKEQEAVLAESIIQLPIWGNPLPLIRSLQD